MNKFIISSLTLILSSAVFAETASQKIADHFDDQRIQSKTDVKPVSSPIVKPQVNPTTANNNKLSITKEELAQHPDLVLRAMIPAVTQGNGENVELLYPIYQQIPSQYHNAMLSKWAEALLAKHQRHYTQSIKLYRELLAENADNDVIRYQLAVTLFENNELEAAEDQFKKLRSDVKDPQIRQVFDQYLNAINQRDRWTFSGGLTYLNDPNINNAPKSGTTYGNWRAPKRESAEGIGFNFQVGKKWSLANGFFNELRLNTNGKYYWDNKKYNEITARGSLGLGYQNAYTSVTLLPFMEQTLYAGGSNQSDTLKRFSKAGGVGLDVTHWLSPQWQLNGSYEYAEQRYTQRKHLNGNYHFVSLGAVYLPKAQSYLFGNLNYHRTATRDKDDSFFRRGITLGWGQEWAKGFSTRFSISYAQKRYKAPLPIFGITQRNNEYGFQASMWHKAVHYWGITPRLTYHYTKTKSNHVFYSYDKHRVFLDFSKQF